MLLLYDDIAFIRMCHVIGRTKGTNNKTNEYGWYYNFQWYIKINIILACYNCFLENVQK